MTERPLQWTMAQVAAEFGGHSAQWLRQRLKDHPAWADFPKPDPRTGLYRVSEVVAWSDRAAPAAIRTGRQRPEPRTEAEVTAALAGRQV
ncbi:hypothetical protein [Ferrovibrio sp.]|uniref:hypothetical protein n=1 Tax=Ferrovibrio sp. TaxID=1917215 RepID=UPI003D0A0DFF